MIATEKNHAGFSVIAPSKLNRKVARKNDVKSLINAFCPSFDNSDKTNPNPVAAFDGLNIQSNTIPKRKYEYKTPKNLTINVKFLSTDISE